MLLSRRRVTLEYATIGLALCFVPGGSGCADDVGTSSATLSTTTTTSPPTTTTPPTTTLPTTTATSTPTTSGGGSGGGTTGVLPDLVACPLEFQSCGSPEECCPNFGHPGSLCPSGSYPDNWTCTTGQCRQGDCADDADCVIPRFECREVGGVNRCVAPCEENEECWDLHIMKNTKCIGVGETTGFCIEEIPSP